MKMVFSALAQVRPMHCWLRNGKLRVIIRQHLANSLYFNAYVLMSIRTLAAVFGFLFWLLAARLAKNPEAIGLATAFISAATLLAGLSQMGIGYALVHFRSKAKLWDRLKDSAATAVIIASLIAAAIFLAGIKIWSPVLAGLTADWAVLLLFVALLLALTFSLFLNWIFLALRKLILNLARHLLQAVLAILLLCLMSEAGAGYRPVVLAFAISLLAGLCAAIFWFLPRAANGSRLRLANPLSLSVPFRRYALANFLVDQLQRAPDSLMPLLLLNMLGPAAGAYFFVAWAMASGMQALAGSAAMSLFAEGSFRPQAIAMHTRRALRLGFVLVLSMASVVGLLSKWILGFYGHDYALQGYRLLQVLAGSLVPGIAVPVCLSVLRVRNQLSLLLLISGLSFASGMLFVFGGVRVDGLTGAGIGWLLSRLFMLLCIALLWYGARDRWQNIRLPTPD